MRMSRKAGLLAVKKYPLVTLLKDLTVVKIVGRNASSSAVLGGYINQFSTGYKYILSTKEKNMTLWKLVPASTGYTATSILATSTGSGLAYQSSSSGGKDIYWSSTATVQTSWSATTGSSAYGATLAEVSFPSYTDTDIDSLLGAASATGIAGRNSVSQSTVSTSSKEYKIILAFKSDTLDVRDGSNYAKLAGTSTDAASISGSTLTLGSVYGGTIIGIN